MIDILIIPTIIALLAVSIWLYRSLEKVNTGLDINTSLSPETSIHSFLNPPITARQLLVKKIQKYILPKYTLQTSPIRQYTPPAISVEPSISGCDGGDDDSFFESLPRVVRYNGLAQIPLKVYQGDSCTITLNLSPSIRNPNRNEKPYMYSVTRK